MLGFRHAEINGIEGLENGQCLAAAPKGRVNRHK